MTYTFMFKRAQICEKASIFEILSTAKKPCFPSINSRNVWQVSRRAKYGSIITRFAIASAPHFRGKVDTGHAAFNIRCYPNDCL